MDKETMKASIDEILDLIGLTKDRCTLSKDLSGGMKRRLSIGIALIGDPRVYLITFTSLYLLTFPRCSFSMNRPVVSVSLLHFSSSEFVVYLLVDPPNRRLIWNIVRKMKEAGKCVILTTHFLEEADILSDRIAIMTNGRLQAGGTPNFLKQQTGFPFSLSLFLCKIGENLFS